VEGEDGYRELRRSYYARWSSSYVFLVLFAVIINDILGEISCGGMTRLLGIVGSLACHGCLAFYDDRRTYKLLGLSTA
jgi:hypothetical protein